MKEDAGFFPIVFGSIKKILNFSGRTNRKELIYYSLTSIIVFFLIGFLTPLIGILSFVLASWYLTIWSLLFLSIAARRLHDMNISGGWISIVFIGRFLEIYLNPQSYGAFTLGNSLFLTAFNPYFFIAVFILCFISGSKSTNTFGKIPVYNLESLIQKKNTPKASKFVLPRDKSTAIVWYVSSFFTGIIALLFIIIGFSWRNSLKFWCILGGFFFLVLGIYCFLKGSRLWE